MNIADLIRKGREHYDAWQNLVTGLGTTRDKRTYSAFQGQTPLDQQTLESLFHYDDLAYTIVAAVVEDAFRQGFTVARRADSDEKTAEKAQADTAKINAALAALCANEKCSEAAMWKRLYGGAAIIVGIEGAGDASTPLEPEAKIKAVSSLHVANAYECVPASYYTDPNNPKYGKVETYRVTRNQGTTSIIAIVHETRVIIFPGAMTSPSLRRQRNGWGLSVLDRAYNTLQSTNQNLDSVSSMLADASQAVFKIKGLIEAVTSNMGAQLQERMRLVDTMRSVTRAILLDADAESFENVERGSVQGMGDIIDRNFIRLSAAARMPVTILMGQAPAGLNATGAIDLRWWYDTVRAFQRNALSGPILELVGFLARALDLEHTEWDVLWPDPYQPTPVEQADLRDKIATTDVKYINAGVVHAEEIAISRFGNGYGTEYKIDIQPRIDALAIMSEPEAEPVDDEEDPIEKPTEEDPADGTEKEDA